MMDSKNIQELLKKDMTRKEFIQVLGAAGLGIIGLTAFLKNIDLFAQSQTQPKSVRKTGYGTSMYGR